MAVAALALWLVSRARRAASSKPLAWVVAASALTLMPSEHQGGIVLAILGLTLLAVMAANRAARRAPLPRWVRVGRVLALRASPWRFALSVASIHTALASLTSALLWRGAPHIQDSQAHLFHARILAQGLLVAPPPPMAELFEVEHVITSGAWYSQYPPGHTAMLALGVLCRAPALVNPVLGGLCLAVIYAGGREIWGERVGRVAALLGLASPFVLFMSSEYMSHTSGLLFFALAMWQCQRALRRASLISACAAGAAAAMFVLTRPLSGLALAFPLALLALLALRKESRRLALPVALMALFTIAGSLLLFAWNAGTTGDPMLMGYVVRWGPEHSLGFHEAPWGPPHTPARGLDNTLSNLAALNLFTFGGGLPVMLLVALGVRATWGSAQTRAGLLGLLLLLAVYAAYFFQDLTFGPRYLFEALAFALPMAAAGILALPRAIEELGFAQGAPARRAALGLVLAAPLSALLVFVPGMVREYATDYQVLDHGLVERARALPEPRVLVLVTPPLRRAFHDEDPDLARAHVVYALDPGPSRRADVASAFAGRVVYVEDEWAGLRRWTPAASSPAR